MNVLATADLHGGIPDKLVQYVQAERKKDKDLILVDGGDFFDSQNSVLMAQWFKLCGPVNNKSRSHPRRTPPVIRKMGKMGYDAVVLGNHEFLSNDKYSFDEMILDLTDYGIPVLSANLCDTSYIDPSTGDYAVPYVNPYIIKKIETEQGDLNVGILGLTVKEVGESSGPLELKDFPGYGGSLMLKDLVQEAGPMVKTMRYNGADLVIAVVHSGEEPKNPKHPGNRIKELARNVAGIDAIVAAHTHVNIPQHKYKNKQGETVIVTQPGKHGEYISKINFTLTKEKGKWIVKEKSSTTHKTAGQHL